MSWTDQWIGLRWRELARGPEAYDCFGLYAALLGQRLGIHLQDPAVRRRGAGQAFVALRGAFDQIDPAAQLPREGDALVFRMRPGMLHIGYALNESDMLHAARDIMGSAMDRFTSPRWRSKLQGVYRPHAA